MSINNLNSLLERSPIMPEYFWKELEESNQAKAIHVPLALVLQAEKDEPGSFAIAESRAQILTIAKTHRVAFKMIGKQAELREKIQETKQQLGRSIDLLVICAHGSPDAIHLSKGGDYTTKNLCKEDFEDLSTTGKIILISCSTGQLFAPQLASITELDVVAPIVRSYGATILLYSCEEHGFEVSSVYKGDQQMRIFHPRQELTMPCIENPPNTSTLEYLMKDAMLGNARSQCSLGIRYMGGLYVEQSSASALYWLNKAVDGGSIEARTALGQWYYNNGDCETAERHLLVAAKVLLENDALGVIDIRSGGAACELLGRIYKDRHHCPEESLQIFNKIVEKYGSPEVTAKAKVAPLV